MDRRDLEKIYRDLEVKLYNFALRWVFDRQLAEEIVHDAFLRVWRKREQVDYTTLKGLLYKTIQNLAINEIRKRKFRNTVAHLLLSEPNSRGQEATMIEEEELRQLRILLEKLPIDLREVLLMSEFSDMSYREIATALGIAEGTVASRKNRAIENMRQHMGERNE